MGMNNQPNMNMEMNNQPNMNMVMNNQSNMNMGINNQPNMNMGMNNQPNMNVGMNNQPNMNMGMNNQPNMYMGTNMYQQFNYNIEQMNKQKIEKDRKNPVIMNYSKISTVAKIIAVIVSVLLYKNTGSFTFPISVAVICGYLLFENHILNVKNKVLHYIYIVSMIIISFSTMFTDDRFIHFFNFAAIICLMVCFYLVSKFDDKDWDFGFYLGRFVEQFFCWLSCIDDVFSNKKAERIAKNEFNVRKEKHKMSSKTKNIVIGLVISLPIAFVALGFLAASDKVFSDFVSKVINIEVIFDFIEFVLENIIGICFFALIIYIFTLANRSYLYKNRIINKQYESKKNNSTIGTVISIVLNVIYFTFSIIQIRYLFLGSEGDKLPIDTTYASYARSGFATLLVFAILNLLYVLIMLFIFEDSIALKITLLLITLNTYIMIASSAMRTLLYIKYKYLTYTRVIVFLALTILALTFIGVICRMFNRKFPLFKYCVIVTTICWIVFAYIRPERIIAKVNYDNAFEETQYDFFKETELYDDYWYLSTLGLDAYPVLTKDLDVDEIEDILNKNTKYNDREDKTISDSEKKEYIAMRYFSNIIYDYSKSDFAWYRWNVSRYSAKSDLYDALDE